MTEVEEKTEFEFSELSERAKDAARQAYIANDYPHDDWWDGVFEDAVRMGALLGIQISATSHIRKTGGICQTTDIFFSGFWSQGDGASFEGAYACAPEASRLIRVKAPEDETLHRIADQLSLLQTTRRLLGLEPFRATISTTGGYCHSGTMDVAIDDPNIDDDGRGEPAIQAEEESITKLMRDFADWIYNQLENEHDYLTSDEVVDEQLAEEKFDEAGAVI